MNFGEMYKMSYSKNAWNRKNGFVKGKGGVELPLAGQIVAESSEFHKIQFVGQAGVELLIHGPYEICFQGEVLNPDELIPEVKAYFLEMLRGSRVISIIMDNRNNLTARFDAGEEFILRVAVTANGDWEWEFWQFNSPNGYLFI